MPLIDRWYLDGNFVNPAPWGKYTLQVLIENMNMARNGSAIVSMYSLLGFDNATFSKSMPMIGATDSVGEIGSFPATTANRPNVAPFPGWARWTNRSQVVKLGMIWTFPVTVDSKVASLHLSVEPGILWRYVDLYSYEDFHPNVFNQEFYSMTSELGEKTLRLLNVSVSKVEQALSNMAPVQLVVETPVGSGDSPDTSETSNVKVAWLNMSDNTWVVLCNTSVSVQDCSGEQQLQATVYINTSLFFDYARNLKYPYGADHVDQYGAGDAWSAPLEVERLSYYPLGFASNYSAGETDASRQTVFTQRQLGCIACDARLQGGGTCDGCGGRFEVFNYSGCYVADAINGSHPNSWTHVSSPASKFSGRKVTSCDSRVVPFGVPRSSTGSCSPTGYQGKVVLQPGGGFRAFIEPDTFRVTVGVGLCVTPIPDPIVRPSTFIPDLVSIDQNEFKLCSDIMRLYYDAKPVKNILVSVPIQYKTSSFQTVSWYSVKSNSFNPICSRLPVSENSIWLSLPSSLLANPDFNNGAKGCDDVTLTSRKARCDGFGARLFCLSTTLCTGFTPACTSSGQCLKMSNGSIQAFNGSVTISGAFAGTLSVWKDTFQEVYSDTWDPDITQFWDPGFLKASGMAPKVVAAMYGDPARVVRVLFNSAPEYPVTVTVNLKSSLSQQEVAVVKLAWFNRSADALYWTPICSSNATADGVVSATLDLRLLTSPFFGNWTQSCSNASSVPGAKSCQKGAFLVAVVTPWSFCRNDTAPTTTPLPGAWSVVKSHVLAPVALILHL
jgi:hypothetical protein